MESKDRLLIGELARRAGVHRETLRYYERRGLLKPHRLASGYRVYDREAADRLIFIKEAQSFGFSLDEIGELLKMRPESPRSCDRVMRMLDRKIADIERQIAEMRRFRSRLSRYRTECRMALDDGEACPLILEVSHRRRNGETRPGQERS